MATQPRQLWALWRVFTAVCVLYRLGYQKGSMISITPPPHRCLAGSLMEPLLKSLEPCLETQVLGFRVGPTTASEAYTTYPSLRFLGSPSPPPPRSTVLRGPKINLRPLGGFWFRTSTGSCGGGGSRPARGLRTLSLESPESRNPETPEPLNPKPPKPPQPATGLAEHVLCLQESLALKLVPFLFSHMVSGHRALQPCRAAAL